MFGRNKFESDFDNNWSFFNIMFKLIFGIVIVGFLAIGTFYFIAGKKALEIANKCEGAPKVVVENNGNTQTYSVKCS